MNKAGYYSTNLTQEDIDNHIENPAREKSMISLMVSLANKYNIDLSYSKYSDVLIFKKLINPCRGCGQRHFLLQYNFQTEVELIGELDRFKVNMCDDCIEKERNRILKEKILKLKENIKRNEC